MKGSPVQVRASALSAIGSGKRSRFSGGYYSFWRRIFGASGPVGQPALLPGGVQMSGTDTPSTAWHRGQFQKGRTLLGLKELSQRSHLSKILPRTSPARSACAGPWVRVHGNPGYSKNAAILV